ncbi:scavenger receptor [Mactra antiquata]
MTDFDQERSMWYYTVLVCFMVVIIPREICCLDCYNCTNLKNVSDCHQITVCGANQGCYTDTTGFGDQTRFTMGCRDLTVCTAHSMATTTSSPLSIIGRATSQLECTQCCGVDGCNKHLCTSGTHAISSQTDCVDDVDFDCAQVSSLFNVCGNRNHAKIVCRRFCGLCEAIDGGWSVWSSWSKCDTTCGSGIETRSRACDDPPVENGGLPCIGNSTESQGCNMPPCPVNGGWALWSAWDSCSHSCGIGLQGRTRHCSNPSPSHGGLQCQGNPTDVEACFLRSCADGVWSSWSSWGSCSQTCLGGLTSRQRQCNSPTPSNFGHDCVGSNREYKICNSIPCQVHSVNGHWASWHSWSTCSVSCGGGVKKRTRTCTNPSPTSNGLACIGNSEDMNVCNIFNCPGASLVRLIGPTNFEGRLEVFYNGGWGTVCDDSFSDIDARTVCRMMNLPWTGAIALPSAFYGQGTLPIKLDDVGCSSTDNNLFACTFSTYDNCGHSEDVGVACYPPLKVRLRGGSSSHNGRIEVSFDGTVWGTVCDDGFTNHNAEVVCRMLGFTTHNARYTSTSTYGQGSGEILLDDIVCTGSEDTLLKCKHNKITSHNCDHGEDVGVICG